MFCILYFTGIPTDTTYSFDYIKIPDALTGATSPVIPSRFQDILIYGMAVENEIQQLSPKATSYAQENQGRYNSYILDMAYWNSNLMLN